jgi:hypothetical protein
MKRLLIAISVVALATTFLVSTVSAARSMPPGFPKGARWRFVKGSGPPATLAVGETQTILIEVKSKQPFQQAIAMTNAYYPGRGVFFSGASRVIDDTYALLELTITGKNPTTDLPGVCDWPLPGAKCTPDGVAPLAIALGLRYQGNEVYGEYYPFTVEVVP